MHKKLLKVTTASQDKTTLSKDSSINISNTNSFKKILIDHNAVDSNITTPKMTKLFSDIQKSNCFLIHM